MVDRVEYLLPRQIGEGPKKVAVAVRGQEMREAIGRRERIAIRARTKAWVRGRK